MIQTLLTDWVSSGKSATALIGILASRYLASKGIHVPEAAVVQVALYALGAVGIAHKVVKYFRGTP